MPEWTDAGADADLAEGTMVVVGDPQDPVAVARAGGRLYAFDDTCTHEDCSLADGDLEQHKIICPCHFAEFDVRNGACGLLTNVVSRP